MFYIEKASDTGPLGDDKMVADHERGVWLQRIANRGPEPGQVFKLVWGERVIPFETVTGEQRDAETGDPHYLIRFATFGTSAAATLYAAIPAYHFQDEEERRQARLLAAEALLVYGSFYSGDTRPDGYFRVELDGRAYTKKDFDMA